MTSESMPNRRPMRLRGHAYGPQGRYFVTICTQDRRWTLGQVVAGQGRLTAAGRCVQAAWTGLPDRFAGVALDAFVVMPNHVHGIVVLQEPVGARFIASAVTGEPSSDAAAEPSLTLGEVIRAFKAVTTRTIRAAGQADFGWQRNYHDRIVRSDTALARMRIYIQQNPKQWERERNRRSGEPDDLPEGLD